MTTTPADELRTAAEKLRLTAGNATEGAWAIWHDLDHQGYITVGNAAGVITPPSLQSAGGECNPVAHVYVEEDADHIILMHPGVGLAVARWLESWTGVDLSECGPMPEDAQHALAVARQVLGTVTAPPETDTIGLCAACGDPREGHHHGYERTPGYDEAQQPTPATEEPTR